VEALAASRAAPTAPASAQGYKRLTVAIVALGALMTTLDSTVVNVALPVIRKDFGYLKVSVSDLQWVVNAYALTYAAFLLTSGKLGDLFGRRKIFLVGIALFTAASIGCGAAGNINTLVGLRAVQGIGAAILTPCGLSILTATFEAEERGLAVGLWSAVLGIGVALGPLVGGVLVDDASWRWVFFINVPVGILCFISSLVWVKESRDPSPERRFDVAGVVISALALFALTFGLLKGQDFGWTNGRTIGLLAGGIIGIGLFIAVERSQRAPMLPLSLFRSATFAGANAVAIFAGFILFGELFFSSLLLQTVMGYSALKTGESLLPLTLMIMFVSPVVGKLMSKGVGPRWLITAGLILLADSLVLLARLGFGSDFLDCLPPLVLGGVGFAFVLTPLTTAALAGVPVRNAGVGSGVINTTRQVGGTLGLAVMVTISTAVINSWLKGGRTRPDGFVHSFDIVMLVGAAVCVLGALVAVITIARHVPAEAPEAEAANQLKLQPSGAWPLAAPSVLAPLHQLAAAALEVTAGPAAGNTIPLARKPLVLGRRAKSPWNLLDDPRLSSKHARLSPLRDGRVVIEDLGSTNGTFLNGTALSGPSVVNDGDTIRLGSSELRLVRTGPAPTPAAAGVTGTRLGAQMASMTMARRRPERMDRAALVAVVESGRATGTTIPIGEELIIGRAEAEPGRLRGDAEISRRHASISELDGTRVLIEDLASTNGTFVNGHRIYAPTVAVAGDEVRVGATVMRIEAADAKSAAAQAPVPAGVER
jgi:EmrB/QacA subfamily drug resistance transporter